eukprot:TRINITY_DN9418_c0_g2_i7.p1 TRINITY_DN9418_c0_g2~~TRINITY_DN9418_c0_g2_i7.p1  ORF type:complete len:208 (+),score=41.14 TRINITY_DN9418_c0_g2_i7:126-749(+)
MNALSKMAIGTGIILVASAIGYLIYKKSLRNSSASKEESIDSESVSENARPLLIQLMDEVILDSLEELHFKIDNMQKEGNRTMRELQTQLGRTVSRIEEIVCAQNGWNAEEYEEQIKARETLNDKEVLVRLDTLEHVVSEISKGNKPRVKFKFHPLLNKDLALSLYRQILISHLYTAYKTVRDLVDSGENIDAVSYTHLTLPTICSV